MEFCRKNILSIVVLFVSCLLYIFCPYSPIKFVSICYILCFFFCIFHRHAFIWTNTIAVPLFFIFTFLFTPVGESVAHHLKIAAQHKYIIGGALTLIGIAWVFLFLSFSNLKPIDTKIRFKNPSKNFRFLICGLLIAVGICLIYLNSFETDVSYGGDEHYHTISIEICQLLLLCLISKPIIAILWLILIVSAAIFRGELGSINKIYQLNVILILVISAVFGWLSFSGNLNDELIYERALRYPCLQPWLSAILGGLCYEYWGQTKPLSFGVLRFLPMISLYAIAMLFFLLTYRKIKNLWLSILIVFAICTIPILLYHGSLIYLEMPLVAALGFILYDAKRWVGLSPDKLWKTATFLATVALCFLKETGIAIAILLCLVRLLVRLKKFQRKNEKSLTKAVLITELKLYLFILLPGIVYLILRYMAGYRPYQLHFENLANLSLWFEGLSQLVKQYGLILAPAIIGFWRFYKKQRYNFLICLILGAGIWLYHFLENPQWIGLARFNLMFVPIIGILTIEGLTGKLTKSNWFIGFIILLIFVSNILLSPIDLQGRRSDWGKSGERWYNWTICLTDIKQENPNAKVLVANMPYPYGIGLVLERIGWEAKVRQIKPLTDEDANLTSSLEFAKNIGFDFVIYRYEKAVKLNDSEQSLKGFKFIKDYPSRCGGLILFEKKVN